MTMVQTSIIAVTAAETPMNAMELLIIHIYKNSSRNPYECDGDTYYTHI